MTTLLLRTPLVECRSALALAGLRTREDYDELVHAGPDREIRVTLRGVRGGQQVRCLISLEEQRLPASGIEVFHELAVEGHPVVSYGAGRGQVSFGFEWMHPKGADWRISAQRVEVLLQRVTAAFGPKPAPARPRVGRRASLLAELVPAQLRPVAA